LHESPARCQPGSPDQKPCRGMCRIPRSVRKFVRNGLGRIR
jgi:hypothetical protein